MVDVDGIAMAIYGLVDAILVPISDTVGGFIGWAIAGIGGFIKAVIEKMVG